MTGLPPLEVPALDETQRRSLALWLQAACERVEREARFGAVNGAEERGRRMGAERVAEWLLSCVPHAQAKE